MRKLIIFVLFSNLALSQNIIKYSSYSMENPKKSYNIMLDYDNDPIVENILIDVESDDPIFKKSSFILTRHEFYVFLDYLKYMAEKKNEWDKINIANKITSVDKKIEWYNKNLKGSCVYLNGPIISQTPFYADYYYRKGKSYIIIKSNRSDEVDYSFILFPSSKHLEMLIEKLNIDKFNLLIEEDIKKKNLLK
ncbi:hypothetical protein [Chryseobacterium sp. HMWF035]|uniref:hypothetical protein n=1 Tax=Chryseobacterium sp. HMWF035 TaxID=2056868 RepID=UPI000E303A78|nr:hypothetical protein [Chryseobacterium sp. HMWF035]